MLLLAGASQLTQVLFGLLWFQENLSVPSLALPSWAVYSGGFLSLSAVVFISLRILLTARNAEEIITLTAAYAGPSDEQALRKKYYTECAHIIAKLAEHQRKQADRFDEHGMRGPNALIGAAGLLMNYFNQPSAHPTAQSPI